MTRRVVITEAGRGFLDELRHRAALAADRKARGVSLGALDTILREGDSEMGFSHRPSAMARDQRSEQEKRERAAESARLEAGKEQHDASVDRAQALFRLKQLQEAGETDGDEFRELCRFLGGAEGADDEPDVDRRFQASDAYRRSFDAWRAHRATAHDALGELRGRLASDAAETLARAQQAVSRDKKRGRSAKGFFGRHPGARRIKVG